MSYDPAPTTTRHEVSACQLTASSTLRMSLRLYKTIKATSNLAAIAVALYALDLGADPTVVFVIVGAILVGPEVLEYEWANGSAKDDE